MHGWQSIQGAGQGARVRRAAIASLLLCAVFGSPTVAARPAAQSAPSTAELPRIADFVGHFTKLDGFLPLYWDERTGGLYLEIPRLDQELLYVTGLGAGMGSNDIGLDRGLLVDTRVVRFERVGNKVLMVQPNLNFRAITTDPDERHAVEDAFATSVLWGFTAIAEGDGHVLVDLGDFLMRDATGLSQRLRPATYRFDRSRSAVYLPNTKAFPKNTEIEVTSTLVTDAPGPSPGQLGGRIGDVVPSAEAMTVRQHHSFIQLPDGGYTPRAYDPGSGYFDLSFMNFSAPFGTDLRTRYLTRHRLEKKDPTAAISDPVTPIVYYVDRGAPEPIRSALIEGASWWNQAFEAAGFRNAFRVELMPEGADIMDVRYNTITWVHRSTRGWSYGASIVDPRTGEILKGHVSLGSLRAQQDYLIGEGLLSPYVTGDEKPAILTDMAVRRLRQLAAHEVGHTLGLGHNYYDSKLGQISVMDYPHPFITLRPDGSMDFSKVYATGIGEWDKVAIRYGYGVFPKATEAASLKQILDDAWAKDLRYYTNQDLDLNPLVDQWNNGNDNAAELNRILDLRRAGLARFGPNAVQAGWPLAMLEEVLVPLYLHHRYATEAAAAAVGGQDYRYAVRGDGRTSAPAAWVPAARQHAALDALMRTLKPSELTLSAQILANLPPRPPGYAETRELFPRTTGGAFDPISPAIVAADMTIGFVLAPDRAARLVAQKAVDPALPGLDDVVDRVVTATFSARTSSAYEAEVARATQRVAVSHLMRLAASAPLPQARAIATLKLKAIQTRMSGTVPGLSIAEAAHRQMLASDIQRFFTGPGDATSRIIAVVGLPPGAPIGEAPYQYLLGEPDCDWLVRR